MLESGAFGRDDSSTEGAKELLLGLSVPNVGFKFTKAIDTG